MNVASLSLCHRAGDVKTLPQSAMKEPVGGRGRGRVRIREGGQVLQTVDLDRGGFVCALGGPDGRTLFVVAAEWLGTEVMVRPGSGQVLAVDVTVPGAG
jgi:sugar lactone lactonase YvrE